MLNVEARDGKIVSKLTKREFDLIGHIRRYGTFKSFLMDVEELDILPQGRCELFGYVEMRYDSSYDKHDCDCKKLRGSLEWSKDSSYDKHDCDHKVRYMCDEDCPCNCTLTIDCGVEEKERLEAEYNDYVNNYV